MNHYKIDLEFQWGYQGFKNIFGLYKQWIVLFRKMRVIQFVCAHRRSYKTTSFEMEQSTAYIYISKTFPTTHYNYFLIVCMPLRWVCNN